MSIENQKMLKIFNAVLYEDEKCLHDLLSGMNQEESSRYLGATLAVASSVHNLNAVSYILDLPDSNCIQPNGEYGLGRALYYGCESGIQEIVSGILSHQNARDISIDGSYSLNHARAVAITKHHFILASMIDSKKN